MPARQLPKTLSTDELDRLLAAPNLACATGLRDRCVLELMCCVGLRVSEVCGLHLRDVDWTEHEIRLRPEVKCRRMSSNRQTSRPQSRPATHGGVPAA